MLATRRAKSLHTSIRNSYYTYNFNTIKKSYEHFTIFRRFSKNKNLTSPLHKFLEYLPSSEGPVKTRSRDVVWRPLVNIDTSHAGVPLKCGSGAVAPPLYR